MASMRIVMACWLTVLCSQAQTLPPAAQCSEECIKYILDNPSGPRVLRLFKELMMPDAPGAQKTMTDVNGQTYGVTPTKKSLIKNAMRKGLSPELVEKMLDYAAILPHENESKEMTNESGSTTPAALTTAVHLTTSVFPETTSSPETTTEIITGGPTVPLEREGTSPTTPIPPVPTTTTETETSTPSTGVFRPPRYNISSGQNGDVYLMINGTTLKMPDELPLLNQLISDKNLLMEIINDLKNIGVPIAARGTQVSVGPERMPAEPVHVRILATEAGPFKVQIRSGPEGYDLPGDDDAFNQFLSRRPEIAYQVLSLLALHRVLATVDQNRRFYLPGLSARGVLSTQHGIPNFAPRGPKFLNVGQHHFTFPNDWDQVQRQVQSQVIPAAEVQRALEMNNVDCPPRIVAIILGQMTRDFDNLVQPIRQGNRVFMRVGSVKVRLPTGALQLADLMRKKLIAQQFVRHSFLTLGLESEKRNGGLRVRLPDKQDCFLPDVPSFKIFDYQVTPQSDGTVHIACGPDVYTLPRDRPMLMNALETKKILPLELVDALNKTGIPAKMDFETQDLTVQTKGFKLSFPIKMRSDAPARLNLFTQGRPGNLSFLVEVNNERFSIPKDVDKINDLIRANVIDPLRLIELITQRTYVPHTYDTEKGRHIIQLDGKRIELLHSSILNDRQPNQKRPNDSSEENSDEKDDG